MERVITRQRLVPASPAEVFEVLADPRNHAETDGSGFIVGARDGNPERLLPGTFFVMEMRQKGMGYAIRNEVVEFEEGRRIAWRVRPEGRLTALREFLVGGHCWRYQLEEVEGGTLVTESWDWRGVRMPWLFRLLGWPRRNGRGMEESLDRLAARFSVQG